MKKLTKDWFLGILAVILISLASGCSMQSEKELETLSPTKFAANNVLKKGWVTLPIPMYISASVPEEFRADCQDALDLWNAKAGKELFEYRGLTDRDSSEKDGINVISWSTAQSAHGYFGETKKRWIGENTIIEADVIFFGKKEDFASLRCPDGSESCFMETGKKDILTTALHEFGHVLGFVHTDEPDHLMNPDFSFGDIYQHFDETLISELRSIYNPDYLADASQ